MKKFKWTDILIFIVGTYLVGALSALVAGGDFKSFYNSLDKPPLAPPSWVFPVAWGILYTLMAISAYLVYAAKSEKTPGALGIYAAQLLVNFMWAPVFFGLKSLTGAAVVISVLLIMVIVMIACFAKIRRLSALLNVPYALWVAFAAYLNYSMI